MKKKIMYIYLEDLMNCLKTSSHADIKSTNIVYSQSGNKKIVKFIDFGTSLAAQEKIRYG